MCGSSHKACLADVFLDRVTFQLMSFLSVTQLFTVNKITNRVSAEPVYMLTASDFYVYNSQVWLRFFPPKSSNMFNQTTCVLKQSSHNSNKALSWFLCMHKIDVSSLAVDCLHLSLMLTTYSLVPKVSVPFSEALWFVSEDVDLDCESELRVKMEIQSIDMITCCGFHLNI